MWHELTLGDGEAEFRDKPFLQGHRAAERDENQFTEHLATSVWNAGLNSSVRKDTVFISEIYFLLPVALRQR